MTTKSHPRSLGWYALGVGGWGRAIRCVVLALARWELTDRVSTWKWRPPSGERTLATIGLRV